MGFDPPENLNMTKIAFVNSTQAFSSEGELMTHDEVFIEIKKRRQRK